MEAALNRRRLIVLTITLALCLAGLAARLVEMQWARHDEFRAKADSRHQQSYIRQALRGHIRDRRGNPLATSVPVKNICADPSLLKGHEMEMARALAPILKTYETFLFNLFSHQMRTNSEGRVVPNQFALLKNKVSVDDWEKIQATVGEQY